jgi:CubicO group peptidase (beta-lactamase class C family)
MNSSHPSRIVSLLLAICLAAIYSGHGLAQAVPPAQQELAEPEPDMRLIREQRRQFQLQEMIVARSGSWIFQPGDAPRIVWRDVEEVQRLGGATRLRVRWFNSQLDEFPAPGESGRWLAWIEGTAPNGTPLRRSLTFFALPKDFASSFIPDLTVTFPHFPGPQAPVAWQERKSEMNRLANDMLVRTLIDSERGAILMAGLAEAKPLGRPVRFVESTEAMHDDYHLALKLKLQGLQDRVRVLQPPRRRDPPATVLREGALDEAGVRPDAKAKIDNVCRAWAEDTGEPFVTLVAQRGVIVTHEAFGDDPGGTPVSRDYRCWVASITKSVTALLFSQFVDQQLIGLDDPLSAVFPDYPQNDPRVPTFRQCLNHTSGLSGHGEFGGMRNPHLENIVLNGIDANEPNVRYSYCGQGFELAAKAMELVTGKSAVRVYDDHLFRPLGFGDVTMGNASSDGEFTAMELGILAQWVANRGSYGAQEFIAPGTFERLLPEPLQVAERSLTETEGIGLHWIRHVKPDAPRNSKQAEDLLFSPLTVGHGSFSGCIFVADLEQQLVIAQVRKQSGPRSAEWVARFFQTIAETAGGRPGE